MGIPDRDDANKIVGRSKRAGFNRDAKKRHDGRLRDALGGSDNVSIWCRENGLDLKIANGGHHWMITGGGIRAEWWPSSAKLVFDKDFQNGIHTHGWDQLLELIGGRIKREEREGGEMLGMITNDMYHLIPEHMRPGMISFAHHGVLPGGFMQAVLRNDLYDAAGRADSTNSMIMHIYASVLHNFLPKQSFGSHDAMVAWAEKRRDDPLPLGSIDWPKQWGDLAERMMGAESAESPA